MLLRLTVPMVGVLLLLAYPVASDEADKPVSLADAVKEFNQQAKKDPTGQGQPLLTEDEVVAAIRGWIRERFPVRDNVYKVYQTIADTKKLPRGATLTFKTTWSGFNNHVFDVWWIDLNIKDGRTPVCTFRIRDQKLRCRPLE